MVANLTSSTLNLNTGDCRAILPAHSGVKSADRISGNNERHYEEEVQQLARWCPDSNLDLNPAETKEKLQENQKSLSPLT
ncbi:hypothetical protein D4764_17G0004030 [Takifugu flavidus]|uniref:Uncharacterized protein n=1 Tax=Takifugu flavidus TaxID=433684 RepID=A0A5C6NYC9_9TELE|nr:hypothetical protein D4764_17G0004030 [Takifugu flavidus]